MLYCYGKHWIKKLYLPDNRMEQDLHVGAEPVVPFWNIMKIHNWLENEITIILVYKENACFPDLLKICFFLFWPAQLS